jgi:hypothetical protein
VGTVIQNKQRVPDDRNRRGDRLERADLLARYGDLQAPGVSQRQAAKRLDVPRTTLQAWRLWHETLDICPQVAMFFDSGLGLAYLPRLVMAFHGVCVEIGACGSRLACRFLQMTGLHRFVGASFEKQQRLNRGVEEALVAYRREETGRLAQGMTPKDITVTQDETCTGGLCLVAIEPVSTSILVEQTAEAREHDTWHTWMEDALAPLTCHVIPSTSDEAPGLLAYGDHHLWAHHSPDLFHVQHERRKAVAAPMVTKQRAAAKALAKAEATRRRAQVQHHNPHDAPAHRGPSRSQKQHRAWSRLCRTSPWLATNTLASASSARG